MFINAQDLSCQDLWTIHPLTCLMENLFVFTLNPVKQIDRNNLYLVNTQGIITVDQPLYLENSLANTLKNLQIYENTLV